MINIVLVSGESLIRSALRVLMNSTDLFHVVDEAGNAEEAIIAIEGHKPDLVITAVGLPGKSGIELIYEINRRALPTKTIVLSSNNSETIIKQAIIAGACGYILKKNNFQMLSRGISAVMNGEKFFCPISAQVANSLDLNNKFEDNNGDQDPLDPLSPREREIFHLLANGMQNATIAKRLFISPRTVETHRARVVRKLGLNSNAELIRYAIKHGLSIV